MTIHELMLLTDTHVEVFATKGKKNGRRLGCRVHKGDIKKGPCLAGAVGFGDTMWEAMTNLCLFLSDQILVIDAMLDDRRREYELPKITVT